MKKLIPVLALAILFSFFSKTVSPVYDTVANELFGKARLAMLDQGYTVGLIWNRDLAFFAYGKKTDLYVDGYMVQIFGQRVDNYGNTDPIPFRMLFVKSHNQFTGWIDFRTHPRPFCGGLYNVPKNCMLK